MGRVWLGMKLQPKNNQQPTTTRALESIFNDLTNGHNVVAELQEQK
jgi:hypothetical protein